MQLNRHKLKFMNTFNYQLATWSALLAKFVLKCVPLCQQFSDEACLR